MQKKNSYTLVVIGSVILLSLLVWLFLTLSPKEKFNWYESYKIGDREPYGTYVIGELMKTYNTGKNFTVSYKKPVHELLSPDKIKGRSSYVFIGEGLFLDSADVQTMLSFVRSGNDVFISSMELPHELTINLQDFQCYWKGYRFDRDTLARMNFFHNDLSEKEPYAYSFRHKDEIMEYYWAYFDPGYLCGNTQTFMRLGYFKTNSDSDHLNFVKIPYGDGNFYFHTVPLVFTNYFMLHERPLDYASKVLSHLKPGDVYWDEYSKIPHYSRQKGDNNNDPGGRGDSPLQFLLQQKSMRWAWFTLIFGVVFTYLIFRTKRRQRVIPLLEPNTNTSLEFVQTIGRLYFLQNNHRGLCRQMMRHYLAFVRNKYYLATAKVTDDLVIKISQRSKVNASIVREIFNKFSLIDKTATEITDTELIAFHQSLENFYKNCK